VRNAWRSGGRCERFAVNCRALLLRERNQFIQSGIFVRFLGLFLLSAADQSTSYKYIRLGQATAVQTSPVAGIAMMGGGTDLGNDVSLIGEFGDRWDFSRNPGDVQMFIGPRVLRLHLFRLPCLMPTAMVV
jgi:hypothetical protein